ncbi:MAG TPA: DUF4019 domain-containing protein [Stellaceae bacterium]|nr:DUF4019 domain-containing protein [Stellaceae bacterium]
MKNILALMTVIVMTVPMALPGFADMTPQQAAEAWLALVDRRQYEESWKSASSYFHSAVTEANWVQAVKGAREPLGAMTSRRYKGATHAKTLPGTPDGDYEVLQFATSFKNKAQAVETVTR